MRRRTARWIWIALAVVATSSGGSPSASPATEGADRPREWAAPLPDQPGLGNLFMVSADLYRGEQPEDEGFESLKKLGVTTVVNLRAHHSDRGECQENGLGYVHIPAQAWAVEEDDVVEFLRVVSNPDRLPVFVHCKHGSDRTGVMTAAYRIVIQGWSKDDAIAEMTEGGYGFHHVWRNLVDLVDELDVDRIAARAGIERPAPGPGSPTGGIVARPGSDESRSAAGPTGGRPGPPPPIERTIQGAPSCAASPRPVPSDRRGERHASQPSRRPDHRLQHRRPRA